MDSSHLGKVAHIHWFCKYPILPISEVRYIFVNEFICVTFEIFIMKLVKLVGTRDVRTQSARAQLGPFLSYWEKGERRPSSGTRAGVGDSPRKHTGPVPVHPWQRAWFMARDPGLRGETRLRHRPGLILTPAVPHTWAPLGPRHVFFYHSAFWP